MKCMSYNAGNSFDCVLSTQLKWYHNKCGCDNKILNALNHLDQ